MKREDERPTHLLQNTAQSEQDKGQKRKSLRLRPSEILDNAGPPSALRDPSLKSVPASTASSRMSLFHLFSRPKVERARGHAEKGFDVSAAPKHPGSVLKTSASSPNLVLRVQPSVATPATPVSQVSAAQPSSASARSSSGVKIRAPSRPTPRERRGGSFEPPPLFQAYPQSIKDGTLELCMLSAEVVQQKSRVGIPGGLPSGIHAEAVEDTSSLDTRRSTKGHFKHVANGSTTQVELQRKTIILTTSGYLLEYAQSGPSDRLPDRALQLGKDSAAFACDLVPGKHYVLQVSQAVDRDGIVVANSGGLLAKLGIRTAAAKRMTSTMLLVMSDAQEMEDWMSAIRREVEALGGTKMPRTSSMSGSAGGLKKTPSQSHRYNVQRISSKVTTIASPPPVPTPSSQPDDKSDTATLEGIELEASKLTAEETQPPTRTRSPSDAPSVDSSVAVSVDQHQLDNLRSSGSNRRFSKASQAPTVATTVSVSRVNSITGSPPSDALAIVNLNAPCENASKPAYRTMASYGSRRCSAAPAASVKDAHSPPPIDTSPQRNRTTTVEQDIESPVDGHGPPLIPTRPSPQMPNRLSLARSEPNFRLAMRTREKHDSKMENERPESIVGELPSPFSSRAGSRRTSMLSSVPTTTAQTQHSLASAPTHSSSSLSQPPNTAPRTVRPKRMSTFTIPLKVNPSGQNTQPASTRCRRQSSTHDPDPPGEQPKVHSLTATVEPSRRASVAHTSIIENGLQTSPSQRLSLFPTQLPTSPAASTHQHTPTAHAQGAVNARSLRRPTSMQVRSDHAPFLSSVRASTAGTVPIRGLKPSRSASNVTRLANAQASPLDAFKGLDFGLPPPKEDDDKPTPLLSASSRSQSPLSPPIRSGSRQSFQRGMKLRSSLPELDLGMPVHFLAPPPAPPPSAPLPLPPPQSRPGSRMTTSRPSSPAPSNGSPSAGTDAIAGLGIRVS